MKKSVSVIFIFIFLVFSASADERNFDAAHAVYTNISGWGYGGSEFYTLSGDFIFTPLKTTYLELKYRF
jgi:hypothetical protein